MLILIWERITKKRRRAASAAGEPAARTPPTYCSIGSSRLGQPDLAVRVEGQERAAELLGRAEDHPAGTGREHRGPQRRALSARSSAA